MKEKRILFVINYANILNGSDVINGWRISRLL